MNATQKILSYMSIFSLLTLSACSTHGSTTGRSTEYLVYVIGDVRDAYDAGHLVMYEPAKDDHTPILPEWIVRVPILNGKGGLAFSSSREGNSEIYILKYPFADDTPLNITNDAFSEDSPLSWSPDGRYLAFESARSNGKTLMIWDGKKALPIYQYEKQVSYLDWDSNNRLAFEAGSDGVFVWDGRETTLISSDGGNPTWSIDGRLAFSSYRDGKFDIYIWNGISAINDRPNINSYVNVATHLTDGYSSPFWTSTDSLMFGVNEWHDGHQQYYEWDGQDLTKLCYTTKPESSTQNWEMITYWSFLTDCSTDIPSYIRDKDNQLLLIRNDVPSPYYPRAWSSSGLLLLCVWDNPTLSEFTLSVWNGTEVVNIAHGPVISAVWRNGNYLFCTNG